MYDAETGQKLAQVDAVDGLMPYGVDAVFLPTSSEYDAALAVGKRAGVTATVQRASCNWGSALQGLSRQTGIDAITIVNSSWVGHPRY